MWTWFVRALMGRRAGERVSDAGGELYEECIASLQKAKEHPEASNTTLQDVKRCKRQVPKLLYHERGPPRAATGGGVAQQPADED